MAQTSFALKSHEPDPQRQLQILALDGLFDEMDAVGVLRHAVTHVLRDEGAVVSSFGANSAVLLHMVSVVDRNLPVFFLETGKHFPETLHYVETLQKLLGLTDVRWLGPTPRTSRASIRAAICGRPIRTPAATSGRPSRSRGRSPALAAGSPAASATRPPSVACCRISS